MSVERSGGGGGGAYKWSAWVAVAEWASVQRWWSESGGGLMGATPANLAFNRNQQEHIMRGPDSLWENGKELKVYFKVSG